MAGYEQLYENGYNVPLEQFGSLSRPCLMPKDEVAPYLLHSREMLACLKPTNYFESAIAWILSDNIWRHNQYRTMEQSLKVGQIQRTNSHITVPTIRAHAEAQVWNIDCEKTNALDKISKLIKRIESSIDWGYKLLRDMQGLEPFGKKRFVSKKKTDTASETTAADRATDHADAPPYTNSVPASDEFSNQLVPWAQPESGTSGTPPE